MYTPIIIPSKAPMEFGSVTEMMLVMFGGILAVLCGIFIVKHLVFDSEFKISTMFCISGVFAGFTSAYIADMLHRGVTDVGILGFVLAGVSLAAGVAATVMAIISMVRTIDRERRAKLRAEITAMYK